MERAGGEKFHLSFLTFFRLHVRLFLNSFGLQPSMIPGSRHPPSLQALTTCCTSALDSLRIVSEDFHNIHVLRYGQDSITVMSAYSAVFLLKLLRLPSTGHLLDPDTSNEIYTLISKTADSYQDASSSSHSQVSLSASYHARFLRSLVANDIFKTRRGERERYDCDSNMPIDPRLQCQPASRATMQSSPIQVYSHQGSRMQEATQQTFHFPASPNLPAHPHSNPSDNDYQVDVQGRNAISHDPSNGNTLYSGGYVPMPPNHASELDAHYWKNMFIELGFGENVDPNTLHGMIPNSVGRTMPPSPQYMGHTQIDHPQHSSLMTAQAQSIQYHAMHVPSYGH
ncbi:hypothetical protein CPB84DRAFT_1796158 [Gymnopilus junonius]|uniref:Uncharacterized protein n=1 Tax=Gymnopilus junonius TaxID=109634 RepID=A0A9P5TFW1_GYMJU|nr:hypothetical protein CPB84DRAFT_1796158 [Gymnopilus junonius]